MKIFNVVTNVVLLAAVCYGFVVSRRASPTAPASPGPYAAGELVPLIPGWSYEQANSTLVVFLRSTCGYCTESLPFYRDIVRRRDAVGASIHVLGVSRDDKKTFDRYLEQHDLKLDRTVSIDTKQWQKITATPTMILVNRSGEVRRIWVGKLSEERERGVLEDLVLLKAGMLPSRP